MTNRESITLAEPIIDAHENQFSIDENFGIVPEDMAFTEMEPERMRSVEEPTEEARFAGAPTTLLDDFDVGSAPPVPEEEVLPAGPELEFEDVEPSPGLGPLPRSPPESFAAPGESLAGDSITMGGMDDADDPMADVTNAPLPTPGDSIPGGTPLVTPAAGEEYPQSQQKRRRVAAPRVRPLQVDAYTQLSNAEIRENLRDAGPTVRPRRAPAADDAAPPESKRRRLLRTTDDVLAALTAPSALGPLCPALEALMRPPTRGRFDASAAGGGPSQPTSARTGPSSVSEPMSAGTFGAESAADNPYDQPPPADDDAMAKFPEADDTLPPPSSIGGDDLPASSIGGDFFSQQGTAAAAASERRAGGPLTDLLGRADHAAGGGDGPAAGLGDETAEQAATEQPERWSSRTRAVAGYLCDVFAAEGGDAGVAGAPPVALSPLLEGHSRKEASRLFFELLLLRTKGMVGVDQAEPYADLMLKPSAKLAAVAGSLRGTA